MKGSKGDTGDTGLPGEAVNKKYPFLHFFQRNQRCECTNGGCNPVQYTAYFSALFTVLGKYPATIDALLNLPHVWKRTFLLYLVMRFFV